MDIFLSVNNRADILQIPVLPSSFTVSKPQNLSTFETVSKKDLQLIGTPKLKGITISSFFPVRDYPYLRDNSMKGWEYVDKIDSWISQKLPIRLVITDTPINMAVAVKNFDYTIKTDGDLWYSLEFEEFNLLEETITETYEEELTMSQYEELKKSIEYLTSITEELSNPMVYNYIDDNMPSWAKESVQKAIDKGILTGSGDGWGLQYSDLRVLLWLDRLGLLD